MLKKMFFYDLLWTYLYVSNSDGLIPVFMSDTDTCRLACLANCFLLCSTSNSAEHRHKDIKQQVLSHCAKKLRRGGLISTLGLSNALGQPCSVNT